MDALNAGVADGVELVPARPVAGRYWTLALLFLMATFSMVDKMLITVLLDPIKREFRLDDTELGLLTGISFSLFSPSPAFRLASPPIAEIAGG